MKKKIWSVMLAFSLLVAELQAPVYVYADEDRGESIAESLVEKFNADDAETEVSLDEMATDGDEIIATTEEPDMDNAELKKEDENIILGDPKNPDSPISIISDNGQVDAGDTINLTEVLPEIQRSSVGFQDPVSGIYANKIDKAIDISMNKSTYFAAANWTYCAKTPNLVSFFDYNGYLNIVYLSDIDNLLHIQRYDESLAFQGSLALPQRYVLWGNAACDEHGNYYVIWAQNDTNNENSIVTSAAKYDYNGNFLGECTIKGYDSLPYHSSGISGDYWGTKYPFDAGNCSVVVKNGVLACNYAREMYSGHQSNFVFYVNCNTMEQIPAATDFYAVPYCSHSFDQRVIITSDGGYLTANHGDAFNRSFYISKVSGSDRRILGNIESFHFREGADRSYGYNETYAQLGNIVETNNAYVLFASSEKTLSLDTAPTNQSYCGHSEARDLFVQFLKKDFYNYNAENAYAVNGDTRAAVGTKPESTQNELRLNGDEVDYGVIWLTNYDVDHYANNPQMVATNDGRLVVMWEKLDYTRFKGSSYFAILDSNGNILQQPLEMKNTYLTANTNPAFHNGKVYWTTKDENGSYIHVLDIDAEPLFDLETVATLSLSSEEFIYDGTEKCPTVSVTASDYLLEKDKDYSVTYSDNVSEGQATVTIRGINNCIGTLQKTFYIKLDKPQIVRKGSHVELTAFSQGDASIIYTKDGSDPSLENGTKYNGKNLSLDVFPGYIKAIAVDRLGKAGDISTLTLYDVSLNKASLRMDIGTEDMLQATVLPADASDKNVVWSSSDESIVQVDQSGKVSAVSEGKATVTATSSDGESIATCEVEVIIPVSSLSMKETEYILYTGDELQLDVQVQPDNATNKTLIYDNPAPNVVQVDTNGKVTALAGGRAELTIHPEDGIGTIACTLTVRRRVKDVFNDMFEKDWWYSAVQYAYDNGLMQGTGDSFEPNEVLPREQFVQVLYNISGKPSVAGLTNSFNDVKKDWYHDAVLWATAHEVTNGIGEGRFGVGLDITREQLVTMIFRYAGKNGYDTTATSGIIKSYSDSGLVHDWAQEAFDWAVSQGIVTGKGTGTDPANLSLDPQGTATRAECAAIMMRLLQKNGK